MGEESPDRVSIEDLEALRQEFSIANVRDDLRQVQLCSDVGVSIEEWAHDRGVPLDYARRSGASSTKTR